jgi:flagellar biogenesis protein FliO
MKKAILLIPLVFFLTQSGLFALGNAVTEPANSTVTAQNLPYLSGAISSIESPKAIPGPSIGQTIITMLASLLFIIGLIYLVSYGLKFFYVRASIPLKSESMIKVLAKEYLDSKNIIYVVEFDGKILVLSSAGEHLNKLMEVTDMESVERIRSNADEYISRYRLKNEGKFDEQLKASYLNQGRKIVTSGNEMIKNLAGKFKKKGGK